LVAQPTTGDQARADGECVAGEQPLQCGLTGAEVLGDRRGRHRDDRGVEELHEVRDEDHGQHDGGPAPVRYNLCVTQ
jgi:hypothetical protein